jgi:signal transduction histidine kinase
MIQEWSKTYPLGILEASTMLTGIYESEKNKDSTLKYLKLTIALKDSLFSREKTRDAQSLAFNEQLHQQQLVDEKKQIQNKIRVYTLLVALFVFLLVGVLLWRNNRHKQKANALDKIRLENELKFQQLEGEKTKAGLERQAIELQIKAIVTTQEEERKRISRDLHDDVGTKLSAVNLFLSSLSERATRTNDEEIKLLAQSSKQILKETMTDVRQILRNLNPLVLEEYGYIAAVTGLANKINETKQVHFNLEVPDTPLQLDKENELMLYRITQELINNVLKHAEAKHVWLSIEKCEKKIVLKIEDDGNGFDINVLKDGYGLHNLDARTKLMQGSLVINSQPGKGTMVIIEIPYDLNKSF